MAKRLTNEKLFPKPSPVTYKFEMARRPIKEKVNSPSSVEPKVILANRPEMKRVDLPLSSNKEEDKDEV